MLEWKTILRAIKYQRRELIVTSALTFLAGVYVILSLPDIYVSSSNILIEREGMFSDAEEESPNDNLSRRMHAIVSTVLSTDSITTILRDNDMIAPSSTEEELQETVEEFRDQATLDFDNVAVINQYTGKSGMYSQGLKVEFEDPSAETAFTVAQALTDRILEANKGKGEKAVEYRRSFLLEQYRVALDRLTDAKQGVASYKNENALYLPEVHPLVIRRYEEIELQRQRVADNVSRLRRELDDVRGELATSSADAFVLSADGTRVMGTDEQLRLLEAEYARAQSRYTTEHPILARLKSELEGLRRYAGAGDTAGIQAELKQAQQDLSAARERYSDDHPDVRALEKSVATLQRSLAEMPAGSRAPKVSSSPSNPAYNRMLIRRQSVLDDIEREGQHLVAFDSELDNVKDQLARMPLVEQRLETLVQKHDVAATAYEEIEAELERLNLNFGMQQADLLDRFVLLEPPRKPFEPSKPNKSLLLLVLSVLAALAGLLIALLLNIYRDQILDSDDIENMLDIPVYMIPKLS